MKNLIAIATLAALAAFSLGVQAQQRGQQQGAPQQQAAANPDPGAGFGPQQLTTFKVRDNFYMIRNGQSGNCSVLIADDGVVLIDNKFEMDHDGIMTKLREFTDKPVLYVINTHMHGDHSGGNAKKQALGAKVIAHENARFQMAMTQTGLPTHARRSHAPIPRRVYPRHLLARTRSHRRRHRGSFTQAEHDLHGRPIRDLGSIRDIDRLPGRRQSARVD
jgi:hypothetical protein